MRAIPFIFSLVLAPANGLRIISWGRKWSCVRWWRVEDLLDRVLRHSLWADPAIYAIITSHTIHLSFFSWLITRKREIGWSDNVFLRKRSTIMISLFLLCDPSRKKKVIDRVWRKFSCFDPSVGFILKNRSLDRPTDKRIKTKRKLYTRSIFSLN